MRSALQLTLIAAALAACNASVAEPIASEPEASTSVYGTPVPMAAHGRIDTWKPAPAKGHAGDIQDLACKKAASLGCPQPATCAQMLRDMGADDLWEKRMATVFGAKTKKELDDTTVIPCPEGDAGGDR